ncbi:MAG: hypothetical protein WBG90_05065 [Saonia sp.]
MIHQLCNIGHEHHIDTFYRVAVFEAGQMPSFNHLTDLGTVEDIITNIPDSAQVFLTDLLPNNIRVTHRTRISAAGKLFSNDISFLLTPQDKNLQDLLNTYNNREVIAMVSKRNTTHLYGTSDRPLLLRYDELNNPQPNSLKGYSIKINGNTYGTSKLFESVDFNIYSRGLAFELAQQI